MKLKDHRDLDQYLSEFNLAQTQFVVMGISFSEYDLVHAIVHGLPSSSLWAHFKQLMVQMIQDHLDHQSSSGTPAIPDALLNRLINCLTIKCQRLESDKFTKSGNGSGSEYSNYSNDFIRRHTNNPHGVVCTVCRLKSHDRDHFFAKGGGMKGQGPKGRSALPTSKRETMAISKFSLPPPDSASLANVDNLPPIPADISCALIDDLAAVIESEWSSIVDSGATSHLIKSMDLFWTYDHSDACNIRTANHGILQTMASGNCVALIRHNNSVTQLKLRDCLHTPSAFDNLVSVTRLTAGGIRCMFDMDKVTLYKGNNTISSGIHVQSTIHSRHRICSPTPAPSTPISMTNNKNKTTFFSRVEETMDLWHHRMGHVGEAATKALLKSMDGVHFPPGNSLSKCKPCIIGKHACAPAPSSLEPKSSCPLELIHCDLCGPFPVETPHGKQYFILFIDDFTGIVNLQLLVTKDQAYDVWLIIQARWKNKLKLTVEHFRCDSAGELQGKEQKFVKQLQMRGIL